jgi:hypothetical protein
METTTADKSKEQVSLFVECVHRRCPLRSEETKLEAEGLAIEKQGQWQKAKTGVYRMDLVVSLDGNGKGEIRVLKQCPKTGLQKEILEIAPL